MMQKPRGRTRVPGPPPSILMPEGRRKRAHKAPADRTRPHARMQLSLAMVLLVVVLVAVAALVWLT